MYHNQSQKKSLVTLDLLLRKDNSNLLDDLFFFNNRTQSISDLLSACTILILRKEAITTGWSEAAYQIQGPLSIIKHLSTT